MEERMRLVLLVKEGCSVSDAAERCGVSRVTAYKWLERFEETGACGLADRSRAPNSHPNQTDSATVSRILSLRDSYGWGPVKIRAYLQNNEAHLHIPAASTIGQLLKVHGRSCPRKRRRVAPHSQPLAHCNGPNRVWCADFKGWFRTGDGQRCDPLTITDGYSRYLLRCQIVPQTTHEAVEPIFDAAFREYGLPQSIRTDNGVPFAGTKGLGLSRLAVKWIKYGITPERIRPGNPQENGRHERMHRTLKKDTLSPPAKSSRSQQRRFDSFQKTYNELRPHQALKNETPAEHYRVSQKTCPRYPSGPHYSEEAYKRFVYDKGSFWWREKNHFLSSTLAGEYIILEESPAPRYLEIYFGHVRIAWLDTKHECVRHSCPKVLREKKEE